MRQTSIIVILPYFGPLPSTFRPWLRSAELNKTVDFLIVTDQQVNSASPNITVKQTSFKELRDQARSTIGMELALNRPYKLCDLKPLYGIIFEKEISGHDFWGYCDCDLIFGDIRAFLTEDILDKYNSILGLGHLHLQRVADPYYRSVLESTKVRNGMGLKEVLQSDKNHGFDEMPFGVNAEYYRRYPALSWTGFGLEGRCYSAPTNQHPLFRDLYNDYELYLKSYYNDFSQQFICWQRKPASTLRHVVFLKEKEKLYAVGICDGDGVRREEILYAHFIKRQMNTDHDDMDNYIIIPNKIIAICPIDERFLRCTSLRLAPYLAFLRRWLKR